MPLGLSSELSSPDDQEEILKCMEQLMTKLTLANLRELDSRVTKRIAVRYLRSWFVLDVISTIPYEMIATALITDDGEAAASEASFEIDQSNGTEVDPEFYFRAAGNLRLYPSMVA